MKDKRKEIEQRLGESLDVFLRREYVINRRSSVSIAKELGVNDTSIRKWIKKYNIPIRTLSEIKLPIGFKKPTKEWLEIEYITNRRSSGNIGKELRVGDGTVICWLKSYNIELRTLSETRLPIGVKKPTEEWLIGEYINRNRTTVEISEELGVSISTINRWIKEYNILIRNKRNIYEDKSYRKETIDKLLKFTGKQPEELNLNDFIKKGVKEDGCSCGGIVQWYRRTYSNIVGNKLLNIILKDLYNIEKTIKKQPIPRRQSMLLKNLDYMITEIKKVMKEYGFKTLPSPNKLWELNQFGLSKAIVKYHGGFPAFRAILNQSLGIQSEKQQLENLLDGYLEQ